MVFHDLSFGQVILKSQLGSRASVCVLIENSKTSKWCLARMFPHSFYVSLLRILKTLEHLGPLSWQVSPLQKGGRLDPVPGSPVAPMENSSNMLQCLAGQRLLTILEMARLSGYLQEDTIIVRWFLGYSRGFECWPYLLKTTARDH